MLRITDGMMVNNTRRQLNSNMLTLDEYERQISSGTTISKPSDNPAGTVKSLRLRTSLLEGEQYLDNINDAISFMQTTDGSLNDINQIIQSIREKTVQAATATNNVEDFAAIAQEIGELQDQLKIVANATYGSKYIFAGTNVTEVPYDDGEWSGNDNYLSVEIGVGVTAEINVPQMKSFLMGEMNYTKDLDAASGISSLEPYNLKEGEYQLGTELGTYNNSNIRESQSYLSAVANNDCFFYQDAQNAATLGIGRGLLNFENSDANKLVLEVSQPLSTKSAGGVVTPLADATDISTMFDLTALPAGWTATYNVNTQGEATITFQGATALTGNATVSPQATANLCYANGNDYVPATARFDATAGTWQPTDDATYSGSLAIEVLSVDQGPHMFLDSSNSNGSQLAFNVDQALFQRDANGKVVELSNGDDISSLFDMSALPTYTDPDDGLVKSAWTATYSDNGQGEVKVIFKLVSNTGNIKGSNATQLVVNLDQQLCDNTLTPLADNTDISSNYNLPSGWTAIYNDDGSGAVTVTFQGASAVDGDTIAVNSGLYYSNGDAYDPATATFDAISGTWDSASATTLSGGATVKVATASTLCNSNGNDYIPATATFNGVTGTWHYQGTSNITANVKGHIYGLDGTERDIELKNVVINMEAEAGEAIFSIDHSDIDSSSNSVFTNDLVVFNSGSKALGGIDLRTPALQAGDKTILNFGAQSTTAGSENINLDYNFTDIDGNQVGNGGLSYVFNPLTMDNKTKQLQFFTMDQETGVVQDAALTFKTNTLATSTSAATFDYTEGLFGYINELCGTIESGKLPQVGNMLEGTDSRLQDLLYYRSTIGARINRLELQQSRLENAQTTLTDLLSKNEDTDQAKVIMQLKLQENVYQASLAVGARIIQPTLIDYLS